MPILPALPAPRLELENVTLCAVSSSNVAATIRALDTSLRKVKFANALLFTHSDGAEWNERLPDDVQLVPIKQIGSSEAYSRFLLEELVDYITTSHCLIIQWDGHVLDAQKWRSEFLEFDYIGASWPQFDDAHRVGNGGFSLRSRRLLEACRKADFIGHHPEDVAIGRTNRPMLEAQGLRFAPIDLANLFSAERASNPADTFGFHGVFLMPEALGAEAFWEVYETLDDRTTIRRDLVRIRRSILKSQNGIVRALRLSLEQWLCMMRRRQ